MPVTISEPGGPTQRCRSHGPRPLSLYHSPSLHHGSPRSTEGSPTERASPVVRQLYVWHTQCCVDRVSIPVAARLDESVVEALDEAVAAGIVPTRGAAVARAVSEWLQRHGEAAIVESYRRRYTDSGQGELIERLAAFSVAACLADSQR